MNPNAFRLPSSRLFLIATLCAASLVTMNAHAQYSGARASKSADREGMREFSFMYTIFKMPTTTVKDVTIPEVGTFDAVMDFEDVDMGSIGFGINVDDHLNLNCDFGYGEGSYTGTWGTRELRGRGSMWNVRIAGDYNFLAGPISPFITAGIGYNAYDTGIPTGDIDYFCWWDYLWNTYVCSADVQTYRTSEFTWSAGVGVRWDVNESFYGKIAYTATWMELGAAGTEMFPQYQFSFGWMY